MSEFRIISPGKENIVVVPGLPDDCKKYEIIGAEAMAAKGHYGRMLFQRFRGDSFDIWYSNYLIEKSSVFEGSANEPLLELCIPFVNCFNAWWDGVENNNLHLHQFNISYAPFSNTKASFTGGMEYHTFDIHFKKRMLETYGEHCRLLSEMLNRMEQKKDKPVSMLDQVQFINFDMVRVIKAILTYRFHANLAKDYFTSLVKELLTLLTIHVAWLTDKPKFSSTEINKAREVQRIITTNFKTIYKVEKLAEMVDIKETRLQAVFKSLYRQTVWQYSHNARLEHAHQLLERSHITLKDISFLVGYFDIGNFSMAFSGKYGYQPGEINKRRKRNSKS